MDRTETGPIPPIMRQKPGTPAQRMKTRVFTQSGDLECFGLSISNAGDDDAGKTCLGPEIKADFGLKFNTAHGGPVPEAPTTRM